MGADLHHAFRAGREAGVKLHVRDFDTELLAGVCPEPVNDYLPEDGMVGDDMEERPQRAVTEPPAEIMVDREITLAVRDHIDRYGEVHEEIDHPERGESHQYDKGAVHP